MDHSRKQLSIIIPCRNEEAYIGRCLDSLLASDVDFGCVEIVVVDGMSTDRTREIVEKYANRYSCVRLIDNPERNKPAALNLGIRCTTGEVVMRIDAHSTYAKNYVARLVDGLERHRADNIGGIRDTHAEGSPWQKAIGIVISHRFAVGNAHYRTGVATPELREVDTVFCGCYRRSVFEKIGLFHPRLIRTQDRELNARLTAAGGKILLDPTVRCTYFPRTGFRDYTRWNFAGAFWVYYAGRFTSTKMRSVRNLIPACFVAWHLLVVVAAFLSPAMLLGTLIPIATYWALASLFAAEAAYRERSLLLFPSLLLLFATTHYVYGVASWLGLIMQRIQGIDFVEIPTYQRGRDDGEAVYKSVNPAGTRSHAA